MSDRIDFLNDYDEPKKRLLEQNERLRDMVQDFSIQMKACSVSAKRATEALEEFGKQIKLRK